MSNHSSQRRWIGWRLIVSAGLFVTAAALTGCADSASVVPKPSATAAPPRSPLAASSAPPPSAAKLPAPNADEAAIWSELRQGQGYVLLFRHALAPGTGDPANFQLADCSTQRNLSAAGRQQAVRIGETLQQQNLTVARLLSSQWCRCLETAALMDLGQVEPFPMLNSFFQDRSSAAAQTEQLRQFILENRDQAGVTVMVTHQVNITAISDILPQSGAAVVMRAATPERVELVGQLNSF